MIINTGNRTDIPAFYSEWFANRIIEGRVCVRNPYNPSAVTEYDLSPEIVDCIVFCTKNPTPMLDKMDLLKNYGQLWYVTITPYEKETEPNVPEKHKIMESFKTLSRIVGKNAVGWRYDPIFIDEKYTLNRHIKDFETMAKNLCGYTELCIISFIDLYEKTKRNFPSVRKLTPSEEDEIVTKFAEIAKKYNMIFKTCGEDERFSRLGADTSGCLTKNLFEKATGEILNIPKIKPSRKECACYLSCDIGEYNTCAHFCRYCYANYDKKAVIQNMKRHNKTSPLLIGNLSKEDNIVKHNGKSFKDNQLRLF